MPVLAAQERLVPDAAAGRMTAVIEASGVHVRLVGFGGQCPPQTTEAIVRPTVAFTVGLGGRVLTAGTPKTIEDVERTCAESPRLPR